jgi:hypothetical protein
MLDELLLISGIDVPFPEAQISVHQPILKEIGYIGEEAFFIGSELLNFSKESLSVEDKINLEDKTDFEVFMSIMKNRSLEMQKSKISAMMVLSIVFPDYHFDFKDNQIVLEKEGEEPHFINNNNYVKFKSIIADIFCLKRHGKEEQSYNPMGKKAQEIAAKIKKGREKVAESKGPQKVSVLSRYVSILAVGEHKSINDLCQYTVYQLFDEFDRFELEQSYDMDIRIKLAGGKTDNSKEVDNWMKDIHALS